VHLKEQYDLILLDLQMPGMTGFQVMQKLSEAERTDGVAILVISADPALKLAALEAGANDFLSKPFHLADVMDRVRTLMANAIR
jgi:DNA-binding response OmpR family regulator